jgi:hypothetical protein
MNTSKPMMDSELAAFLHRLHPVAESKAVWLGGAIRLTIKSYLGSELPPVRICRRRALGRSPR